MTSPQVPLKIAFNGDIHRTRVDLRDLTLFRLTQLTAQTFGLSPADFVVQYRDAEGDCITVETDADVREAVRAFQDAQQQSLKFSARTRRQVAFQEQVADPLVASVEQLMRALAGTLEQLKCDAHFASSAAPNVVRAETARDAAESPKTAASGFSSFAQGLVGQINRFIPEKKAGEAPAALPNVPAALPDPEPAVQAEAPPAPLVPGGGTDAAAPTPLVAATHETPSIASSVAFSEAEVKWAEQLSVVSSILPNVSPARIIDVLEKSGGDLNVALNVLTEEN
ncbi:unnamed protein product [Hyaloperonospora brassicae]|uniref:PB1 domain-containing protein n=1 Tax=Hyaloperonospora brassicae TaxID=162125 RepID=A0AAV0TG52_HYABA|nr:unnamed protein product [Hyaloperonospora brassicae]